MVRNVHLLATSAAAATWATEPTFWLAAIATGKSPTFWAICAVTPASVWAVEMELAELTVAVLSVC